MLTQNSVREGTSKERIKSLRGGKGEWRGIGEGDMKDENSRILSWLGWAVFFLAVAAILYLLYA
jgi:hypothetical protein